MWLLTDLLFLIDRRRLARAAGEVAFAVLVFGLLTVAMTWPALVNLDEVVLGGGELGGWMWRQWWHFQEVDALGASDLSLLERGEQLLSLGRFPETGNILDVLLISYPLDRLVGFPAHHNLKVMGVLLGNGLCGYALARSLTDSRSVAVAAGALAIVNPLVVQDINKTGLRQVLLWWVLLYPIFLQRAVRNRTGIDGVLAGLMLVAVAAFYWFYGLFAGVFSIIYVGAHVLRERPPLRELSRWIMPAAVASGVGTLIFVAPYLSSGAESGGGGGVAQLPELTFFLPFPDYDTIAAAPLRPQSYRDNVLSSLHRTIDSAWPADFVANPTHGVQAMPLVVLLVAVIPAFFIRRARLWLLVWVFFFFGTIGPFLKLGAQKDTSDVVMLGEFVVRLPFTLMFQFIPGLSRMFAPYRMASLLVVASVALLALVLHGARPLRRRALAVLALAGIVLQPFYRFDLGPVDEGSKGPEMWRVPTQVSAMALPEWYGELDPEGWEGLIELPLDQQQDLICAYQSFHRRKVYRSWASGPAIPPEFRRGGGGEPGKRMRWLARPEPGNDPCREVFDEVSHNPLEADVGLLVDRDLDRLMDVGSYRWLVVHERGYYLAHPREGAVEYRHVVRAISERLGMQPVELTEQQAFEWPGKDRHFPVGPAWVPWASQEVQLPTDEMPTRYFMAVFDLHEWQETRPGGPPVDLVEDAPGGATDAAPPDALAVDPSAADGPGAPAAAPLAGEPLPSDPAPPPAAPAASAIAPPGGQAPPTP